MNDLRSVSNEKSPLSFGFDGQRIIYKLYMSRCGILSIASHLPLLFFHSNPTTDVAFLQLQCSWQYGNDEVCPNEIKWPSVSVCGSVSKASINFRRTTIPRLSNAEHPNFYVWQKWMSELRIQWVNRHSGYSLSE